MTRTRHLRSCAILLAFAAGWAGVVSASAEETEPVSTNFNLAGPTAGGKQFWTDRFIHNGWRIQRNVLTGHHRLLDAKNVRRAWGTYDGCRNEFEQFRRELDLPPVCGKVLVTLHGLGRSRSSMAGIGKYLADNGPFTWINVSYASTRDSVDGHARALAEVIDGLDQPEEVDFVAHSLGNLVIRRYLARREAEIQAAADTDRVKRKHPPLGRIVMLAPPNQGAAIAERLKNNDLFRIIAGTSGHQLADQWDQLEQQLATPPCPFGIVAGGRGDKGVNNPLLKGDDDFVVTVEETRLPGAADFLVVPRLHTFIMDDPMVRESTLRFLKHGYFVSEKTRQPIEKMQ